MSEYFVPARYAKLLLKVAVAEGYDVNRLIDDVGLPFNPLGLPDGQDLEITALTYSRLYRKVSSLLQDEAFGLGTHHKIPMGTFRMMCYCIIHCTTLEKALNRMAEFHVMCHNIKGFQPKITDPYVVSADGKDVTLVYSSHLGRKSDDRDPSRQLRVINSLSLWHRFCCWLIGTSIAVKEVNVVGPAMLSREGYRFYFDCPFNFGQLENSMKISAHYLDAPLVHTEESLESFLETAPYQLFTIETEKGSDSIIPRMRSLIGYNFTKKIPSFDEMAGLMNISARTLRRRLEKEGTSYQQIKDECRRDAAIDYLSRSELSINAVAALMGFDEPSAFHRSFKKWTGITPGEFRKSGGGFCPVD